MADVNRKKPGSLLKKLALALGAGVVVLGVLAALAPRFVDWEKVRKAAETEGSKALGRDVRIKELKVSLLSGVEIGGFRIGGARGTDQPPLVQADRVVARYRLLPLLWLKVVINRIELDEPKLWVGKDGKGRWSFADLTDGAAAAAPGKKAGTMVLPVGVDVETVRIMGAVMTYRDASVKPVFNAGVERLDVVVRNFSLSGAPATLKVACTARMDGKAVPVTIDGKLGIALDRSQLTLNDLTVTVPGVKAALSGQVLEFQTLPTFKLTQDVAVELGDVWTAFREFIPKSLRDWMKLGGHVTVHAEVGGTMKKPDLAGTVQCKGVSVSLTDMAGALEELEGKVAFTSNTLTTADLRFLSLGSAYTLEADLKDVGIGAAAAGGFNLATWSPRGKFTVESPKVVLDRFLPPLDAKPAAAARGAAAPAEQREPDYRGMVPKGVTLDGTVSFKEVVARKVKFSGMKGKVAIAGGNVSYDLADASYGGKQVASGRVLLTKFPLEYAVEGKLSGWQVRPFVDDAVESFVAKSGEMKGRISGLAEGEYKLTGRGITLPSLRKHLAGSGNFHVGEGVVSKFAFFEKGLGKALKLGWLAQDLPYKSVGGSFTLAAGKAHTPDTTMDPGPDGDLGVVYNGDVDFDMRLKGELATRFHPRHVDEVMKGDVGKLLFVKDGEWAVGYWDVSGTMTLPVLLPSKKHLGKKAKQEATQEIKKLLPGAEDKGKNLLKGFLKKKK